MGSQKYFSIEELKALRVQIDACQQAIHHSKATHDDIEPKIWDLHVNAWTQAEIKLLEAKMWVGKMMEGLGSELPPEFRDKAN